MHLILLLACSFPTPSTSTRAAPTGESVGEAPAVTAVTDPASRALSARFTLGEPYFTGNLTVWPVLDNNPASASARSAVALAEALGSGVAEVREKGDGGSVPTLTLKNKGRTPVLASAGDVVIGGKQDRILTETVVVAPGQEVDVAVNCVEQGRWRAETGDRFAYGGKAELDLRKTVRTQKNQGATWDKVAEVNAKKADLLPSELRSQLAPATGTYRASLTSQAVGERVDPLAKAIDGALAKDPRTVGYVAAWGREVSGIEVYGSPALFVATRPAAAKSLATETLASRAGAGPADTAAARAFLDRSFAGAVTRRSAKGGAAETELAAEGARSWLVVDDQTGELLQAMGYVE